MSRSELLLYLRAEAVVAVVSTEVAAMVMASILESVELQGNLVEMEIYLKKHQLELELGAMVMADQ
jgi:hypothetical protein